MRRAGVVAIAVALVLGVFAWAGPRAAFLVAIGLGFGLVLEGLRFGFAGPWGRLVRERDARGLLAQLLAIGLTAAVALPLLALAPGELVGAHAPVGFGMILGAFIFGMAMMVVLGCGSGTLVNAGSGNLVGLVALVGFIGGSFAGTLHLGFWTGLGRLPVITAQGVLGDTGGLLLTLGALGLVGYVAVQRADPGKRLPPLRLWVAAGLIAVLAVLNLVVAGQPWGIVYGLGLWGAKLAQAGGVDVAATAFWSSAANAERLGASVLTDVTSLTNIGLLVGAFLVMRWRAVPDAPVAALTWASWGGVLLAGLVLGYSARMAFGCNVGAFFSGISTGSLHGWVWFAAAFAGAMLGLRVRPWVLVPRGVRAEGQPA
ncbi:MAG: YeeE/YedE thiosulfate transporter family protein [Alkalilacustris sp.]